MPANPQRRTGQRPPPSPATGRHVPLPSPPFDIRCEVAPRFSISTLISPRTSITSGILAPRAHRRKALRHVRLHLVNLLSRPTRRRSPLLQLCHSSPSVLPQFPHSLAILLPDFAITLSVGTPMASSNRPRNSTHGRTSSRRPGLMGSSPGPRRLARRPAARSAWRASHRRGHIG